MLDSVPPAKDAGVASWWQPALIVSATVLAYANSVKGPFILDDFAAIVSNQSIRRWWDLAAIFRPPPELPVSGRPIANLSFAISYAVGGLNPVACHVWNIAIHVASALALFGLIRRTLRQGGDRRLVRHASDVAFVAALLWAIHPLNSEAVDYLTQRTELLLGLFFFLTLYASVRALASGRREAWQAVAVAACGLGMGCKESMVIAPVMVILFDRSFSYGSIQQALRERWRFYAALMSTWLVLIASAWTGPRAMSAGFSSGLSPMTYLWNQAIMVPHYLRLAAWPRDLVVDYGWPVPLTLQDVLPRVLLLATLLVLTVVALIRWPRAGFPGAWFFLTLAPTSSIVPIATEVGAERRMYLPLAGLLVLVVAAAAAATERGGRRAPRDPTPSRRPLTSGVAAWAAVFAISALLVSMTMARNREYASALLLAATTVDRWPSAVAHATLGSELAAAGRHDESLVHLRQAVNGGDFRARYPLGAELVDRGALEEAIPYLRAYVDEGSAPTSLQASARKMLGSAYAQRGEWAPAAAQFQLVLAQEPGDGSSRRFLADALFAQHAFADAAVQYQRFLESGPGDVDALTNLGIALANTDRGGEAVAAFRRASAAAPGNINARTNLIQMLVRQKAYKEAEAQAREAMRLDPADPRARDLLDQVLALAGRARARP